MHLTVGLILAFGSTILTLMFNQLLTSQDFINQTREDLAATPIKIEAVYQKDLALIKGPALSIADLRRLDYPHLALHYKLYILLSYIYRTEGAKQEGVHLHCYVLNDPVSKAYGLELKPGEMLLGADVKEDLEKLSAATLCSEEQGYPCYEPFAASDRLALVMKDRQLRLGGQSYPYRMIDEEMGKRYLEGAAGSRQANFPNLGASLVMHVDDYEKHPFGESYSISRLGVAYVSEQGPKDMYALLRQLHEEHPDYSFWQQDRLYAIQKLLRQTIHERDTEQWMAVILFVVIFLGLWMIYALRLKKRMKDAAISLAMGSSLKEQARELWLEVHLLLFSGLGTGALAAVFIEADFTYDHLINRYHPETLCFLGGLMLLMGTLATFVPMRAIRQMTPVLVLRENQ